jgi:acyl-CoA hydrolase
MSIAMGVVTNDIEKVVDQVIDRVGKDIIFGMPLALGKPARFVNVLYKRAKQDPSISLKILTALALEKPTPNSDLERRLLGPLVDRVFAGTPDFDYMLDFRAGKLPPNVEIYEFFFKAGAFMGNPVAQQNHLNSNYTHVIRDGMDFGVNVFGQMLSKREIDGKIAYSMGCNTDICLEAVERFIEKQAEGIPTALIGEVNPNLPFMYGDAIVGAEHYNFIIENEDCNYPLFGPPKDAVALKDHMIGLHVSTLLKDGGTIQVGIGALGDAVVAGLEMRHNENDVYNKIIRDAGLFDRYGDLITRWGGTGTFDEGLYGSSEMFVDAFMQMYKSGILKRKVFDNIPIMKLINAGKLHANKIPENALELLISEKGIHRKLKASDFKLLTHYGFFKEGLRYENGAIFDGDTRYDADLRDEANMMAIKDLLGDEMKKGMVILGAFFLGPKAFYDALNAMSEEERQLFGMSGVEKVNQLYGGEDLRRLQRIHGRFINTGMMVNILGAVTSDQLEDGRVVSGIGGQYNFVTMAHALADGRLIMTARSTRGAGKGLKSNIVFNYGHTSIPKHLRDIVVTEYGIADIRGKADKDIIAEMIKVTDSRFQEGLIAKAKKAGKLPSDFVLPEAYRYNTPEKYERLLKPYQASGHFKTFPFGTDILDDEVVLGGSLRAFKAKASDSKLFVIKGLISELLKPVPDSALPYLKRMQLDSTSSFKETLMQKIVLLALRNNNKI